MKERGGSPLFPRLKVRSNFLIALVDDCLVGKLSFFVFNALILDDILKTIPWQEKNSHIWH